MGKGEEKKSRFEPDLQSLLLDRAFTALAAVALLTLLAVYVPDAFMVPDVANTVQGAGRAVPQWYGAAVWQLLGLLPGAQAGIWAVLALVGALVLLPFWERATRRPFWGRPVFSKVVIGGAVVIFGLTLCGLMGL
jgi:quinol-cytochrome oxidoreductase complex cytochrome b subunit